MADVCIRMGSFELPPMEAIEHEHGLWLNATSEEVYLFSEGVGALVVRGGHEIVVNPLPGVEARVLRPLILSWAFAALLCQQGLLPLHASAVAVAGGAVAFLGESGQGKSTMAAALHARGHGIVSDDMIAVDVKTNCSIAYSSFPQLNLWPDAATVLGDNPETLPLVYPHVEKRIRQSVQGFTSAPLPLRRIYVLAEGMTHKIEPLRPQQALVELIRHSYSPQIHQSVEVSWHFRQCAGVVNNVPIRSLTRPRYLPAISDLAQLVEEDLAESLEESAGGDHTP